jgi:undecaprenyl-diphosphatase
VGLDLIEQAVPVQWSLMIIGTVLAGVTAYLTIHFFLKLLERMGMLPFVIYRLALGAFLFYMFGLNF